MKDEKTVVLSRRDKSNMVSYLISFGKPVVSRLCSKTANIHRVLRVEAEIQGTGIRREHRNTQRDLLLWPVAYWMKSSHFIHVDNFQTLPSFNFVYRNVHVL